MRVRDNQREMMGGSEWVEYRGIEGGRKREREVTTKGGEREGW